MKKKENVDFKIIPVTGVMNDQAWELEILKGEYQNVVVRFGEMKFGGEYIDFKYLVVSSPDGLKFDQDSEDFQSLMGEFMIEIIENAIEHDELMAIDRETKEVIIAPEDIIL